MKSIIPILLILFVSLTLTAQVGINTPNPDPNSVLDLESKTKGFLVPRMTTSQRETMSSVKFSQGMMVYDTNLNILFVGYGTGATGNTQWYAMNPWKTEFRKYTDSNTVDMTTMTQSGIKHGNVGIGVAAPAEKLDVNGTVKSTGLYVNGNAGIGVSPHATVKLDVVGTTRTSDLLVTGKVGIGTVAPAKELHIKGGVMVDGDWLRVKGSNGLYFEDYGGGFHMTENTYIRNYNNKTLNIRGATSSAPAMITSGRIGINVIEPKASLDVNGDMKLGNSNVACTSTLEGSLRYNSTTKLMEYCNGTSWGPVARKRSAVYTASVDQNSTSIPISVIEELCGDEDGCKVRVWMTNYTPNYAAASRESLFFYDKTTRRYRSSNGDRTGQNYNGVKAEHALIFWSCHFTDTEYINGSMTNDDANMHLLNWSAYTNETCNIAFFD